MGDSARGAAEVGLPREGRTGTMPDFRLDRQVRIEGWNQWALDEARIGVVGDDDLLASLYIMCALALGISDIILIGPRWDGRLRETAQKVNPGAKVRFIEGFYTHWVLEDTFSGCNAIVDLTNYALANKLLLELGFRKNIPIIRGLCYEQDDEQGVKIFAYRIGREWRGLEELISPYNLPRDHFDDGVLDIIAAGIALDETKNLLMGRKVSEDVIAYKRPTVFPGTSDPNVCVVGAGALGNFVGLGLVYVGTKHFIIMDPDVVEVTNLNRQVFLADGVGLNKAEVLCQRLNGLFEAKTEARAAYFRRDTDVSPYRLVFDCVDNYETRIVLSEKCRDEGRVLISGGTGPETGQVVVYDPARGNGTPAQVLGLYDVVDRRGRESYERETAACAYQREPSVIIVNQIIAGFMVDAWRRVVSGQEAENTFYDSRSDKRL